MASSMRRRLDAGHAFQALHERGVCLVHRGPLLGKRAVLARGMIGLVHLLPGVVFAGKIGQGALDLLHGMLIPEGEVPEEVFQ